MDICVGNKRAILNGLLVCLFCRSGLNDTGTQYACLNCQRKYPVIDHIPRFLTDLSECEQQVKRSFNLEHLRYVDSRHLHFRQDLVNQWLENIQLPADYFKGKLVLDAGCGTGRWTYAMALLGATVVAVDLTDSGVEITHRVTSEMENVVVFQGNVLHLPLRQECFDLVVSRGVLHHTPQTMTAFEQAARMVKKGGHYYIMVYEKHNPVKFFFTNVLRRWLRRLPEASRYQACRALIIKNRLLYRLLAHVVICSSHPGIDNSLELSTQHLGLYDAYAPTFNHLHTHGEVRGWFHDCHFDQVTLTKPVWFTKAFEVFCHGECGGSINMRGVRE